MGRLAAVASLLAVLVCLVAVVDHEHKRDVEFAAQEDAWFCNHGYPSRCTAFDEAAYEQRWEDREFGYRVSAFALGSTAIGLGLVALRRRRSPVADR